MKWLALFIAGLVLAFNCLADVSEKDQVDIKTVVTVLFDSFRDGAADAVFALHSPEAQAMYGTAGEFMEMIRSGFQPLYDHEYATLVDVAPIENGAAASSLVVEKDGTQWMVIFGLMYDGNTWLVDSCTILPAPGRGSAGGPSV